MRLRVSFILWLEKRKPLIVLVAQLDRVSNYGFEG